MGSFGLSEPRAPRMRDKADNRESSKLWHMYFPRIAVEGTETEGSAKDATRDKAAHLLSDFVVCSPFIAEVQPEDVLQSGIAIYVSWNTLSMGDHAPSADSFEGKLGPSLSQRRWSLAYGS